MHTTATNIKHNIPKYYYLSKSAVANVAHKQSIQNRILQLQREEKKKKKTMKVWLGETFFLVVVEHILFQFNINSECARTAK